MTSFKKAPTVKEQLIKTIEWLCSLKGLPSDDKEWMEQDILQLIRQSRKTISEEQAQKLLDMIVEKGVPALVPLIRKELKAHPELTGEKRSYSRKNN